jgi:hypothetical protein
MKTPSLTAALLLMAASVALGQGLAQIDHTEEPPNAHIRPSRILFNEIFVCRAESPTHWVGVSNYFTHDDPWIIAVARVEESLYRAPEWISIDMENPAERIIVNDRIRTRRGYDHGVFYRTDRLLTKGGYGQWKVVLSVDGIAREAFRFTIAPEPWKPPEEVDPEACEQPLPPFCTNLPIRRKQGVVNDEISDLLHNLKRYWW